ncbi:DUF86 domain-containing protein [Oceanobacillus sp. CAU 1775]
MYFIDRKKIEEILAYMDQLLNTFETNEFNSNTDKLALERIAHVLIESTLDVGNMMIDGFIMRDPGSYEDIIDILVDEKVIPKEEEGTYKAFIGIRKELVTEYQAVDHVRLEANLREYHETLKTFRTKINTYLNNELGVANAFIPDKE